MNPNTGMIAKEFVAVVTETIASHPECFKVFVNILSNTSTPLEEYSLAQPTSEFPELSTQTYI